MTTSDYRSNPENFCYRHPDRQSFVLCQRCLRTVCAECQTQLPVGVICPECQGEQAKNAKVTRISQGASVYRARDIRPVATYVIIAITSLVSVLQLFPGIGPFLTQSFALFPPLLYPQLFGYFEPWRLLTVLLVHGGIWHLLLNMFALWLMGRTLEPLIGRLRFVVLYLLSGLGGSVMVVLFGFDTSVVGASGAIFGLFGATLVIGRHLNANIKGIAVILAINLVITFLPTLLGGSLQISWQGHVGGLLAGFLVGFILVKTKRLNQRGMQAALLSLTAVALIGLLVAAPALLG